MGSFQHEKRVISCHITTVALALWLFRSGSIRLTMDQDPEAGTERRSVDGEPFQQARGRKK